MPPLAPEDPPEIGGYRLLGRLGAGGMGRVYLARSPAGRPVAVKIVHAELAAEPDFCARFRREITAAGRVSGAFTATVLDPDHLAPAIAAGTACLVGKNLVTGLDLATGKPRWQHRPNVQASERPVPAAGRFHVATYDGLLSIDAASGRVAWKGPEFTT